MLVDPNKCVIFNHSILEEEQVDRVTVNGVIINPTDASNKNYGLK